MGQFCETCVGMFFLSPLSMWKGKDESHLLSEAHGVHSSPSDISLFSFEALKSGKRMEVGSTKKIPFFLTLVES